MRLPLVVVTVMGSGPVAAADRDKVSVPAARSHRRIRVSPPKRATDWPASIPQVQFPGVIGACRQSTPVDGGGGSGAGAGAGRVGCGAGTGAGDGTTRGMEQALVRAASAAAARKGVERRFAFIVPVWNLSPEPTTPDPA